MRFPCLFCTQKLFITYEYINTTYEQIFKTYIYRFTTYD